MKESRRYQLAIEQDIPRKLKEFGRIIVQSPTGSGKSHMINMTVKRVVAAGKTPLVLSDSIKIHEQLSLECGGWPIVSGIKNMHILPGQCYVAMSQTLIRRRHIIEQFKMLGEQLVVIVDEAHINTMTPIVNAISPRWLIGFTATPHFRWAKHLPELYKAIIVGPSIKQLQEDGYLTQYRHVIRTSADLSKLEEKGGEYTEQSQNNVFGGKRMYDGLFEDLPEYRGKKTVIYVASIKLCEQVYEECMVNGYNATRYHSALYNSSYELSKFTQGACDVCVSVSALTKGWDCPPVDTIVLWRATRSLPLYLQILGRGSRPLPGKKMFTCLDYGGNYERFGAWNMDRDWESLWKPERRKITTYAGVVGTKECPVCHYLLSVSSRSCPNCGYIYPVEEMRMVQGKLLEVENTWKAMENRQVATFNPLELANYARIKDKRNHAIRIAKRMEQETPGFLKKFAVEMGYKHGWVERMLAEIPTNGVKIDFYNSVVR
jgi:superfamily II DNA or RNA helicase